MSDLACNRVCGRKDGAITRNADAIVSAVVTIEKTQLKQPTDGQEKVTDTLGTFTKKYRVDLSVQFTRVAPGCRA